MVSLGGLARKIFGSSNDRRVKSLRPRVDAINALEPEMQALTDDELRARTDEFRAELADGASARRPAGPGLRRRCARPPSARSACAPSTCS